MKKGLQLLFIIFTIIIVWFPSVCFSELKMVTGEYCDVYLGNMKNKKELEKFKQTVRTNSVESGLRKVNKQWNDNFTDQCFSYVIGNYLEKVVVVNHTEKGRKICDKVKITLDTDVVNKYFNQEICRVVKFNVDEFLGFYPYDINNILTKTSEIINIGLVVEIKIPNLGVSKREQLENEQETQFFNMTQLYKDKYKIVDRRHLSKVLEEQKFSSSGLTDSETVKLGKLFNLDIIVLRLIYENSRVTKILKVDTGEVLLFKNYETKKEEWVYYGKTDDGFYYYNKYSMTKRSPNIFTVWDKWKFSDIKKKWILSWRRNQNSSIDGWEKLDYMVSLREVDCDHNTLKIIKSVTYNSQGIILEEETYSNSNIFNVIPESVFGTFHKNVCKE